MPPARPVRVSVLLLFATATLAPACRSSSGKSSAGKSTQPRRVTAAATPVPVVVPADRPTPPRRPVARINRSPGPKQLHVRIVAAGHGDGIILRTPSGHTILMDAGRGDARFLGDNLVKRRLIPYFRRLGIKRLDAFFISHPHWDHFGDPLALRRGVAFDRIYVNEDGKYLLPSFLRGAHSLKFETVHRGRQFKFGRLVLDVLWPPAQGMKPPRQVRGVIAHNNRSLVLLATYGRIKFMLAGDLMIRGEHRLLKLTRKGLRAQVLKMGHHGRFSTSDTWLRAVKPRYAIASCGDRWRQGWDWLPPALFGRLRHHRARLLRTDKAGDILFTTDGQKLTLQTYPKLVYIPDWKKRQIRARALKRRKPATHGPR